jgi:hypothetical protein
VLSEAKYRPLRAGQGLVALEEVGDAVGVGFEGFEAVDGTVEGGVDHTIDA